MKKYLAVPFLLAFALPAYCAHFEGVVAKLDDGTVEGGAESFMQHVQWLETPPEAHYLCQQAGGSSELNIWQGEKSRSKTRRSEVELVYGENGPVRVFAIGKDGKAPFSAAYFILPSGETHLFRISPTTQEPVKASMEWHCKAAPTTPLQ